MHAAIEVHHISFLGSSMGELKASGENRFRKQKTKLLPVQKSHEPMYTTRTMPRKKVNPDDFGSRSPVMQDPFQTKNDTSIVSRVVDSCAQESFKRVQSGA